MGMGMGRAILFAAAAVFVSSGKGLLAEVIIATEAIVVIIGVVDMVPM